MMTNAEAKRRVRRIKVRVRIIWAGGRGVYTFRNSASAVKQITVWGEWAEIVAVGKAK